MSRALALLRRFSVPALAVVWEGQPVGLFSEEALLVAASEVSWEALASLLVGQVMTPLTVGINARAPLSEAARLLQENALACLPVVDEAGRYQGLVCRQEVVAALCNVISPGSLAGMATPLGVYLTNGVVRAGPGDIGLFLTGAFLALLWLLSSTLVSAICWAAQSYTSLPLLTLRDALSTEPGVIYFGHSDVWTAAFFLAQLAGFFFLMRVFPLAATHGAEHQVVHTIEAGEELTPQNVLAHTPVHPRCGTNLSAVMLVIGAGVYSLSRMRITQPSSTVFYIGLLAILAFLIRRRLGGWLQRFATTRRPSQKRVQAAIGVGKELLEKCRFQGNRRVTPFRRLWHMGLLQVLAGAICLGMLAQTAEQWLGTRLWP